MKLLSLVFSLCISSTFASEDWEFRGSYLPHSGAIRPTFSTSEITGISWNTNLITVGFKPINQTDPTRYDRFKSIKRELTQYSAKWKGLQVWDAFPGLDHRTGMIKVLYDNGLVSDYAIDLILEKSSGVLNEFRVTAATFIDQVEKELDENRNLSEFMEITFRMLTKIPNDTDKDKIINELIQNLSLTQAEEDNNTTSDYASAILSLAKEAKTLTQGTGLIVVDFLLSHIKTILENKFEDFSLQDFKDLIMSGKLSSLTNTQQINTLWTLILSKGDL